MCWEGWPIVISKMMEEDDEDAVDKKGGTLGADS